MPLKFGNAIIHPYLLYPKKPCISKHPNILIAPPKLIPLTNGPYRKTIVWSTESQVQVISKMTTTKTPNMKCPTSKN